MSAGATSVPVDELWTRFLAGEVLSAADRAALHETIQRDELLHRRLLHDLRVHGALVAAGQSEAEGEATVAAIRARLVSASAETGRAAVSGRGRASVRSRRSTWMLLAGAAAAAVLIAVSLRLLAPPPETSRSASSPAGASNGQPRERALGHVARPGAGEGSSVGRTAGTPGAPRTAVLLVGSDETWHHATDGSLQAADERLRLRLERLGFDTSVQRADDAGLDQAGRAALVVLSSTVSVGRVGRDLSGLTVPVIALEPAAFARLGLTGPRWMTDMGSTAPGLDEIVIRRPGHPLAAGLAGRVRVLTRPQSLSWGSPGREATVIAAWAAVPGAAVFFAYEAGAATFDGTAPARRVGLFLNDGRAVRSLNEDGWRLFDASVLWAVGELSGE